jgi:integrase
MPRIDNETTEHLSEEELRVLLKVIELDDNINVGNIMKMVLYTGMRRGEIFKLKWKHINLKTGFVFIKDPKGGPDQKIPVNNMAR